MGLDKKFINLFHKVSVKAALAAHSYVGKKDKIAADQAAVDAMRKELNKINMKGKETKAAAKARVQDPVVDEN